MKQTLLFAFLLLAFTALGQDYTKEWGSILEKEADGEVKQAALLTDVIYNKAKRENNQPQIIKAFFFKSKYIQVIDEDAQFKIITEIQGAIKNAKFPANQILRSLYADMLRKIYLKNQSRIRVLANLEYPGNDYRQWGRSNFKDEISRIYAESLNSKDALYKAPTADFEAVVDFAPALSGYKRPLFDFLAECYLDYLWGDIDSRYDVYWGERLPQLFGCTKEFIKIVDGDSLELPAKRALELMQDIERHFTEVRDTVNLDRAVLRRLSYLDKEIYLNDKNVFYLETVSKIAERTKRTPLTYNAMLIKAQLLTTQADKTKYKNNLIEAVALYDEIINNKSFNDIAAEASNLKKKIISRAADIQMMSFTAPEKPILAKINFKNLDRITVSFYKIPFSVNTRQEDFKERYLISKALYFQKSFTLPDKHDFFNYSTEIILPGLEKGNYAVVISPESTNNNDGDIVNINKITVSGLTVIKDEDNITGVSYQVVDLLTGKPLENVKVYMPKKPEQRTGKDGKINVRYSDRGNDNYITFIHQADTLEYNFYDRYYSDESDMLKVGGSVFLDRPLYRPGQTVFFKGIIQQNKKDVQSVVANTYFTVIVEDDNGDEIKSYRLKTNEFGSFTDKFELPKNRTGRFSVIVEEDDDDNPDYDEVFWEEVYFDRFRTDFSVEEYKRPKFEVTFNDVKEAVRLNEKFTVKGSAISFSGAGISGGEVEYRVKRNSRRYWYDSYGGRDENIKEGKTTTEADGNFTIEFNAEPDDSFDPEDLPVFSYSVYADVTDINGETHSSQTTVNAGYHSITVSAVVAESINVNDKASVTLITNNLNGQFKAAKGTVTIYKVTAPERYLAKRPWNEPEIQVITQDEFVRTFPYLPYKTLNDSVIKKNSVLSQAVDTGTDKEILLNGIKTWKSGSYELVFAAKDSVGNEISTSRRFVLKNDKDKVPADKRIFEYEVKNKDFAKYGYVAVELSAGVALSVNVTATDGNKKIYDEQHDLNADKITIKIPINNDKDKLIEFLISYVWQNDYYSHPLSEFINGKNEKLAIEAQVINSKLMPGSKETWSFSVTGSKKPSEVLASMYDASLDRLMEDSSYYSNRWSDFSAFTYNNRKYSYRNLVTTGTTTVSFSERLKMQQTTRSSDAFYMYGFDFDNIRNSYFGYTPKGKLRKKGDRVISGVVTDSQGLPIPGVSITIKGSNDGTETDMDGKYTICVSKNTELMFASIGSEVEYRAITNSDSLSVVLKESAHHLDEVVVVGYGTTTRATSNIAVTTVSSKTIQGRPNTNFIETLQGQVPGLNISTGSGQPGASSTVILRGAGSINGNVQPLYVIDGVPLDAESFKSLDPADITSLTVLKDAGATSIYGNRGANGVIIINTKSGAKEIEALQQVKARKNFDETAFFYPQVTTDKEGRFTFSFTTPEALTEWKLRLLAHNKNAASGYYENTFHTQKDLMVVPNMPRFLRERDTITLVAKVTNLTGEVKTGNALLQLFDAVTMQPADEQMLNIQKLQPFTISAKGSTTVRWKITVPKGIQGVQYKIVAKAGDFSDGEENILPVVTNSITVTESIPLWVKPNSTREYSFGKFEESLNNANITQRGLTLEYTSNPAWLALQSLPYLMEFEHECAEQVFSRYYANNIATHVLNSNPKIAEVFAAWRKTDKPLSKFEQNEELKSILLSESPWILENQGSEEIKNRLALLFDLEKMQASLETSFTKLKNKQMPSGGFPWFEGGKESSYITRHIAAGFGHLVKLGVTLDNQKAVDAMTKEAVQFMDREFFEGHKKRLAFVKKGGKYGYELPYDGMHYLYARSFYLEKYPLSDSLKKVAERYVSSMNTSTAYLKMKWLGYSLYEKGMAALIMNRYGHKDIAKKIIHHLKETSSNNEEWGMYWIENKGGWNWYNAPVETQAILIEAFTEVDNDIAAADAMKVWLLKSKQNKNWPTTKATAEAVYVLLMKGADWLSVKDNTNFTFGNQKTITDKLAENEKEANTGYIKLKWKPEEIKPGMGKLTVENKSTVPGFGGFYWQRTYDEADKDYAPAQGILNITKELYIKGTTADGVQLQNVTKEKPLKIGDLVTVRLVITAKEDMEYLHLKDMRASAFEPVEVISERKYNNGTSYYQSTRDVATHFFFDSLNKGVYVVEYDVRVNNAGDFSNGIATIQSMYAPEFSGNSRSVRVHID